MNRKSRKSSRKRMDGRRKSARSQIPTLPVFNESGKITNPFFNRARRRHDSAWMRHAPGQSIRQMANQRRKTIQKRLRRVLRVIRKELKQALRGRA